MMILIIIYALVTPVICIPAGRLMRQFPETRSGPMFALVILLWPAILTIGAIAIAISPATRKLALELVEDK
jgi:hypothetical protein